MIITFLLGREENLPSIISDKMKKRYFTIMLFIYFIALNSCKEREGIRINLNQAKTDIYYSDFVDSVSYLTLYTHDTCIISGIKHIYQDGRYIILNDWSGNGVCIFYDNKFVRNIANYGRGPQEYIDITSFCLDKKRKHICIYDDHGGKILRFQYDGSFVCEHTAVDLMRDFACIDGQFICILDAYLDELRSGVWTADSNGLFTKTLIPKNPNNGFEAIYPKYFNMQPNGISYYDRYDNRLYFITPDSAYLKYTFNLDLALPNRLKKNREKGLQDYFMLATCYDLTDCLLLFYGSTKKFYQVLFNKADSTYKITENITNNLLPENTIEVSKHYLDEHTLAIELGATEEDYNLHLQLLHIK